MTWLYHTVITIFLYTFFVSTLVWAPKSYAVEHGPIITLDTPLDIGPGSETFTDSALETKYLILHFTNSTLTGADRLEVNLGYDTDVFTAVSGSEFWTRPIGGNSVTINYIDDGNGVGSVTLDKYGRGEQINVFLLDEFMISDQFEEPEFTLDFMCHSFPDWENVACLDDSDLEQRRMIDTARSVGMIIWEGYGACARWPEHGINYDSPCLHSCSAALIDADLILTAGHCVSPDEVASGSFTLDFQTNCDGTRPEGYSPKFYKLKRMVKTGYARAPGDSRSTVDYAIIQIDTGVEGIGVPPLPIRADVPLLGEEIFIIHHPKGTAKKASRYPIDPYCSINSSPSDLVYHGCDVDHGSSGSSLFDLMGQIVGVCARGSSCSIGHQSGPSFQQDFLTEPPPEQDVNVVTVFDRSGSMGLRGLEGIPKIEEAQQATALFNDLLSLDASHQAGLVSFSTEPSDPVDFELQSVSSGNKEILIGPAPYRNEGIVSTLSSGGTTTIGGGLQAAHDQFPAPGPDQNNPAILLMTDGLQNTYPMIEDVDLDTTRLCSVGFGTEASLDGPLLTSLSRDHDGIYTRAGEGLELKKFFVLCFGNIFHTGISMDPFYTLPIGATTAEPILLSVCGEETLTVVLGWEHSSAWLRLSLVSPGGATITATTPDVVASSGATWAYLRLPLPFGGESDGTWQIQVTRPGDPEFGPPNRAERFFVTSVVDGGPYFRPVNPRRHYYTGDIINPLVVLMEPDGSIVPADVNVEIERPTKGTGNILTETGLGERMVIDGDSIDARSSTLISLEQERGGLLVPKDTQVFPLFDDSMHQDGAMESDGIFGNPLTEIALYEGNYTFHARAEFGNNCTSSRETIWSAYVSVGIDPDNTDVDTQIAETLPDGRKRVQVTFTPRDRYGNHLGPGRLDSFQVEGQKDSDPIGGVRDMGDGSYVQEVAWDPSAGNPPGVIIDQPDRSAVVLSPETPPHPSGLLRGFGLLMGGALPVGDADSEFDDGYSARIDYRIPLSSHFSILPALGYAGFNGEGSNGDEHIWDLTLATRFYPVPDPQLRFFLEGGAGIYLSGVGDETDFGLKLGAGIDVPLVVKPGSALELELGIEGHRLLNADESPDFLRPYVGLIVRY